MAKKKKKDNMLPGKQLSGILGLLLCVSLPKGIIVVLLGLVKVSKMVGVREEEMPGACAYCWRVEY